MIPTLSTVLKMAELIIFKLGLHTNYYLGYSIHKSIPWIFDTNIQSENYSFLHKSLNENDT